ncbi:hypothetical protein LTR56_011670 [Elasticomyces elasticus]|nr:hypothetical protein LTR56_011670 [Elasticomyces elasticus]KAK3658544.1 hypothetical protein LTR22_008897 [Elasticomyces elasticus]KAK4921192.1 hypothetical protein LTR49_011379 [Elasticomyces elasticus]KAK5761909.1 hypothetical protein LTS12_007972 [Elasticomyces elasticus]
MTKASVACSRAVSQMRQDLTHLTEELTDELILATMLMAKYDVCDCSAPTKRDYADIPIERDEASSFWSDVRHHRGTAALLAFKQRGGSDEELLLRRSVRGPIVSDYHIFQLRACLFRGERAPASICNGSWHVTSSPAASLDLLMIRVTNVRAEMFGMTCKEPLASTSEEQYRDVITETEELDTALERWLCCIDNGLSIDVSKTESDAPPCTIDHAVLWTQYCAARILLTDSRRRLPETKNIDPICRPGANGLCVSVQQLTDQLARQMQRAIAYLVTSIGDITGKPRANGKTRTYQIAPKAAMVIAWPVAIALSINAIQQPQKQWLENMASTAAEVLGLDVMLPTDTGHR